MHRQQLLKHHAGVARARTPVAVAASASSSSSPKARSTAAQPPKHCRSPKDPSKFSSYDAIRAHLHRAGARESGGGFIAGLLNGLSDKAFGYGGKGGVGAALYRAFVRFAGPAGSLARPSSSSDNSLLNTADAQPTEQSDALAALLMISRTRAAALARRHSSLLAVPPPELGRRVLALKNALPGCDVAALVEARPDLYLLEGGGKGGEATAAATAEEERQQQDAAAGAGAAATAGRALEALREGLPGADVEMVAFEDPALLFHPHQKLLRGLRRLRALWPTADETALAASEPRHLALAVRALGEGQGDDDGEDEGAAAKTREDDEKRIEK